MVDQGKNYLRELVTNLKTNCFYFLPQQISYLMLSLIAQYISLPIFNNNF